MAANLYIPSDNGRTADNTGVIRVSHVASSVTFGLPTRFYS
jgi:hypothetical protein